MTLVRVGILEDVRGWFFKFKTWGGLPEQIPK